MARSLRQVRIAAVYTGGTACCATSYRSSNRQNPRRIDLRQSLRDPFDQLHTRGSSSRIDRCCRHRGCSGSMRFKGQANKLDTLAQLAETLAHSARRIGDRFGLMACDDAIRQDLSVPATRRRGGEADMAQCLRAFAPRTNGASALVTAAQSLTGRRKLVVLASDFQLP